MGLGDAVQNSRRTGQTINWADEDGTKLDLTGTTLTGFIRDRDTGVTKAMNGTLTPDADQVTNKGDFTWVYGTTDVDTFGNFKAQFVATAGAVDDRSIPEDWKIHEAYS